MHYSVLLEESIELLKIKPDGYYVDGTFGRGGHSCAILAKLGAKGRLLAFDKDLDAINYAHANIKDSRFSIVHDSFMHIDQALLQGDVKKVDGILLDLGVSSPQLDEASRGFSFRFDAPLDMRMDRNQGVLAYDWLNTVSEEELRRVLWEYGEERFAKRIAHDVVLQRKKKAIYTTSDLVRIIDEAVPFNDKKQHKATRSFQAIRIAINNELDDLNNFLVKLPEILNSGARVVIISFHSLEDRIVKVAFNQLCKNNKTDLPKWVVVQESIPEFKIIAKKVRSGINEISKNKRSRSAVMRCIEKI